MSNKKNPKKIKRLRLFVTFEGIDGCGKSTQVDLTRNFLSGLGYDVVQLREPGSTVVSEKVRSILLDRKVTMDPLTELLLYEAARSEIVASEIRPALIKNKIVLCDRFYDSTTAYQGYGRKLDLKMIKSLHRELFINEKPDLTFVFDLPLSKALERQNSRRGINKKADRLESEALTFHRRVLRGFREIAKNEPKRVKLIDATKSIDAVFAQVEYILIQKLKSA